MEFELSAIASDCLDNDLKSICNSTDINAIQLQVVLLIQNTRLLRKIIEQNPHNVNLNYVNPYRV